MWFWRIMFAMISFNCANCHVLLSMPDALGLAACAARLIKTWRRKQQTDKHRKPHGKQLQLRHWYRLNVCFVSFVWLHFLGSATHRTHTLSDLVVAQYFTCVNISQVPIYPLLLMAIRKTMLTEGKTMDIERKLAKRFIRLRSISVFPSYYT